MAKNKNKKKNIVENGLANAVGIPTQSNVAAIGEVLSEASPYLLSLRYIQLSNTYKSNGFARLAVDLPVQDAFRDGGFTLDSQTLSADELLQLQELMQDKGDIITIKDCAKWGRLFGGGVVLLNCGQNPNTPLSPETLKDKEVEFLACDRWQCYPQATSLYLADKFTLQDLSLGEAGNVATFDKSRLKVFTGETQPYYIRNQLGGWGASIFEAVIPALSQYLKANNVILELLDEAKIDILKIFGLSDLLATEGGEYQVKKRLSIFAEQKNFKSLGAMDAQDDYIQKQMSFGGLDRVLEKIMLLICSALRIPYSKVFGRGSSGFSSGEDDLENYNGMVMSTIREPLIPLIKWIIDIRCYQLFGRKVDDIVINWKPLRILPETEQQTVVNQKVQNLIQLAQLGVLTNKQVAEQLTTEKIILFKPEEIEAIEEKIDIEEMQTTEKETVENKSRKMFGLF